MDWHSVWRTACIRQRAASPKSEYRGQSAARRDPWSAEAIKIGTGSCRGIAAATQRFSRAAPSSRPSAGPAVFWHSRPPPSPVSLAPPIIQRRTILSADHSILRQRSVVWRSTTRPGVWIPLREGDQKIFRNCHPKPNLGGSDGWPTLIDGAPTPVPNSRDFALPRQD